MRNILFRAKGADKNDRHIWYTGCYYQTQDTTYCFAEDYEKTPENTHHYILFDRMTDWGLPNRKLQADINPDTLCEFTGKRDTTLAMIWERDIVRITNLYNSPATVSWYVARYREKSGAFVYVDSVNPKICESEECIWFNLDAFHSLCRIEVMGNEIDNPDMLKNIRGQSPDDFYAELDKNLEVKKYD
jgi:hypothetical protein